jgi:mercuric reductase
LSAAAAGFAEGEDFPLRPGVRMPDWSLVADPAARAALAESMAVAGRREKWAGLSPAEDRLWQAVLRGFAAAGRAPAAAALADATGLSAAEVADLLAALRRRDLLVQDAAGEVSAAYPFSARETPHRVTLGGAAWPVFALCAIDALGAGAMLGLESRVESACAACGAPIRIRTAGGGRRLAAVEPEGAVVWCGIRYAGGCAATSGCALKLFFCSEAHLDAWRRRTGLEAPGHRLTVGAAHQLGMALFVPMLASG